MSTSEQPILSVKHLSLYTGELSLRSLLLEHRLIRRKPVLSNISFELFRGECLVIMDDGEAASRPSSTYSRASGGRAADSSSAAARC